LKQEVTTQSLKQEDGQLPPPAPAGAEAYPPQQPAPYPTQPQAYYPPMDTKQPYPPPPGEAQGPYPPAAYAYPVQQQTVLYPVNPPTNIVVTEQRRDPVEAGDVAKPVVYMILSCFVFWCCNCVFGAVAFAFALASSFSAADGDRDKAVKYGRISLYVNIAGIIFTIVLIIIIIIVVVSTD